MTHPKSWSKKWSLIKTFPACMQVTCFQARMNLSAQIVSESLYK